MRVCDGECRNRSRVWIKTWVEDLVRDKVGWVLSSRTKVEASRHHSVRQSHGLRLVRDLRVKARVHGVHGVIASGADPPWS